MVFSASGCMGQAGLWRRAFLKEVVLAVAGRRNHAETRNFGSDYRMMKGSIKNIVPLEAEELSFIREKFRKERHSFWRILSGLMVLGAMTPLLALYLFQSLRHQQAALRGELETEAFPDYYYLVSAGAVMFIIFIGGCYSYWATIRKMALDVKRQHKVIERVTIVRKVFMPQNQTCHFYLNSKKQLSIEVVPKDYSLYREGDEINIEYSRYSGEYLGYF